MGAISSRIFKNGNSQAVRIPHEFQLNAQRVEISKTIDGDLLIHPITDRRGGQLLALLDDFDDEFILALEQDRKANPAMQDRDDL
jgi:antitoxin VapB